MNKKTITIGVPAHNEEKNIASLLDSILSQKGDNFIINKIIITCDGCTDSTASIVYKYSINHKVVELINDGERIGQAARLNRFYETFDSDIFITFDGDVVLGNNYVISELIKPFADKKVGLVGGLTIPYPQENFVGKCVEVYEHFWKEVIKNVSDGNNVHSHTGPVSAGSKEFLKTIRIPIDIVASDHFLYFEAIKRKFDFKSARQAYVYIKVPTTFNDYMNQSTRFLSSGQNISRYFGNWVEDYYHIPYLKKLNAYLITFIKNPVYLPFALILVAMQRILSFKYLEKNNNGVWTTVKTSK